jgi:glycosyltransferase involved in cell wall biosynthesis
MKISIVIPSYNQAGFISLTLESILNQQFEGEMEVIVMDGGSTDQTTDILKGYGDRIRWTSEKDRGQADAVNKGVEKATGDLVGWLNSDDLYLPGTLKAVEEHCRKNPESGWYFGKCRIIDAEGDEIWRWVTRYKNFRLNMHSYNNLISENYISQPAVFFKKELFIKAGKLDLSLHYAMDYDLWLRFEKLSRGVYINRYLSSFRRHGDSKSETDFTSQFREQFEVAKRYGPNRFQRARHQFNIYKVILAYKTMKLVG